MLLSYTFTANGRSVTIPSTNLMTALLEANDALLTWENNGSWHQDPVHDDRMIWIETDPALSLHL